MNEIEKALEANPIWDEFEKLREMLELTEKQYKFLVEQAWVYQTTVKRYLQQMVRNEKLKFDNHKKQVLK